MRCDGLYEETSVVSWCPKGNTRCVQTASCISRKIHGKSSQKQRDRDFFDDPVHIFHLRSLWIMQGPILGAESWEPKPRRQDLGKGWMLLNQNDRVFCMSPHGCHANEKNPQGEVSHCISNHSNDVYFFFLLVICLGNYSCLSMNETIHYSLSKCLFNVAQ